MHLLRILTLFAFVASARASMHDAINAAALLRDTAECRVVKITLAEATDIAPKGQIYGTVFVFEDFSWLYAAEVGNRILGRAFALGSNAESYVGQLRNAGLPATQVTVYPRPSHGGSTGVRQSIPNACVVGALTILERRLLGNETVTEAGLVLLSYHADDAKTASTLLVDHCVLVFREPSGWRCIDPRKPEDVVQLDRIEIGQPVDSALMEVALRARYPLKSARLLPISPSTLQQITTSALWRQQRRTLQPDE